MFYKLSNIYFMFIYLQLLLRKKAAEELKKEQERKAAERRRIIEERCGKPYDVEDGNEGNYFYVYFPSYESNFLCKFFFILHFLIYYKILFTFIHYSMLNAISKEPKYNSFFKFNTCFNAKTIFI